jgi:uncharacterized protein (TIGR03083 family)
MHTPEHWIQLGQVETDRLTQYLHTLSDGDWSHPSACDAWQVRDVVGHLIWIAESYTGAVSRGVQGDRSPLVGFPPAETFEKTAFSAFMAQSAIAVRERLGDQLLATFTARHTQLHQLLAQLSPQDWDTLCYHPIRPFPVRTYITVWATELAMHTWDIRSRLDPAVHLSPESLPLFMDRIGPRVLFSFRPGAKLRAPLRYRFAVTGVVPAHHDIVVEGDQARMEPTGAVEAAVTFHCDTETFVLLMYGRLSPEGAIATGRVGTEGDQRLIAPFGTWFQGF